MAPKKKVDMEDDVKKAKDAVNNDARAVGRAAKNQAFLERRTDDIFGKAEEDWDQTIHEVDNLDKDFDEEALVNRIKQTFERGDVDVRVMQVGPNGVLTDVSDKVNPKDLRPEQISDIQTASGRQLLSRNPQSREAAMRLLQDLLPGLKLSSELKPTTANSIRRMEAALTEGDKILEHWKK